MKFRNKSALLSHEILLDKIKRSGLTQEEFAEEIDISDRHLRNLQTRDTNVSVSTVYNISKFFDVSIEEMLTVIKDDEE